MKARSFHSFAALMGVLILSVGASSLCLAKNPAGASDNTKAPQSDDDSAVLIRRSEGPAASTTSPAPSNRNQVKPPEPPFTVGIRFAPGETALDAEAEALLRKVANEMTKGARTVLIRVIVQDPGSKSRNAATARQRGLNITRHLHALQVAKDKIQVFEDARAHGLRPRAAGRPGLWQMIAARLLIPRPRFMLFRSRQSVLSRRFGAARESQAMNHLKPGRVAPATDFADGTG